MMARAWLRVLFLAAGILMAGVVLLVPMEQTPLVFEPPEPYVEEAPPRARVKVPVTIRNVSSGEVTIIGAPRG